MDEQRLREAASALLQAIGSEGLEESAAADRYQELSGPDDILILLNDLQALRARVAKLEWQVDQCQRFAAGFRDIEAHDDPRGPSQARPCCVHFLQCCASDIEGVVGKFGDEPCVP